MTCHHSRHHQAQRLDTTVIRFIAAALLAFSLLQSTLQISHAQSGVWYVDADAEGADTGQSWTDAFPRLGNALVVAQPGEQIWIAGGTYTPSADEDPNASFVLAEDVAVYGGFGGDEVDLEERRLDPRLVVLSCDYHGDDVLDFDEEGYFEIIQTEENCHHVLIGANGARLDTVTVQGGSAEPTGSDGGGLYNDGISGLTIANAYIIQNSARSGGGIYNRLSSLTLDNVRLYSNHAGSGGAIFNLQSSLTGVRLWVSSNLAMTGGGLFNQQSSPDLERLNAANNRAIQGGGMFNIDSSHPTIRNSAFFGYSTNHTDGNRADQGGAIFNNQSSPILDQVEFRNNIALQGGGIYNQNGSNPTIKNVTIQGNYADQGGGLFNQQSNPSLELSNFTGNNAILGGGIYIENSSNPTIKNVTFDGNIANTNGGGIYLDNSDATLMNPVFIANRSGQQGSGLFVAINAEATVLNGTFHGNLTGQEGGAIFNQGEATVINSVLWGDAGGEIEGSGNILAHHNIVQGGGYGWEDDPLFVAPVSQPGSSSGADLHLRTRSPAIDTGDNAAVTFATDRDGEARISGTYVDLGAYERLRIYVDAGASGANTGISWVDAFLDLNDALSAALPRTDIWVAEGVYKREERTQTFQLRENVAVYGGFAGTETIFSQREWRAHETILNGDLNGDDASSSDGSWLNRSDNSLHVVRGANNADLDGFIIMGGYAAEYPRFIDYYQRMGGGILNSQASPTLSNLIIFENFSERNGSGIYNVNSHPTLVNVIISRNRTGMSGGGIYNESSSASLTDVTILGNSARVQAGGIGNSHSSIVLNRAIITGNTAGESCGGIHLFETTFTLTDGLIHENSTAGTGGGLCNSYNSQTVLGNVTISENTAGSAGGITNQGDALTLTNVTISGNTAQTWAGAALVNLPGSDALLEHVTLYGNHSDQGAAIYNDINADLIISSSILWGDEGGEIATSSYGSRTTVKNSIIQGGWSGEGNLDTDPLLAPRGFYGGFVQTAPLLPGSPAIDALAGLPEAACPAFDARGLPRPEDACDLGAFESQGFTLSIASGDGQSTLLNTPFPEQLIVNVIANDPNEPVDGGKVIFTAPASGPSAVLNINPATVIGEQTHVTAVANGEIGGPYEITASARGGNPVTFHLTNIWFDFTYYLSLIFVK